MANKLAVPKGKTVRNPLREPDYISKRGKPYWFGPDWTREVGNGFGRIKPVKVNQHTVDLYMLSKDGNLSYIQGSIQREFQQWHEDQEIDVILLGIDPDAVIATDWEYDDEL